MTIATAANAVTLTPNTVTPFPESVIIITMAVINIAELDIHVAELPIDNAELSISVSEFAPNYPTVAGDNAKGSTSPATTLTPLLHLIIYIYPSSRGWGGWCIVVSMESLLGAKVIQKVLFLFRASPYASACGCRYSRERALGYPPPPTAAPAHRQAEKEQNQKAAVGGKKKRLYAGTKRDAKGDPSPAPEAPPQPSPRGWSSYLLCFRRFSGAPSPWGRLGWGFYVCLYAPLATL